MSIYAISDLHLSFCRPVTLQHWDAQQDRSKPMDKFGWQDHERQIRDHWLATVGSEDTVLIPGDTSWAMRLEEAAYDFAWLAELPGRKIFSPGNHCYYYRSKQQMESFLPSGMEWLDADYALVEGKAVVAARGWLLPGDPLFREAIDRKIYERQVGRLRLALEKARAAAPESALVVMLHYPPLTAHIASSGFVELCQAYQVELCIYGHLHGRCAPALAINGERDGVRWKLVACDALAFRPSLLFP